MYSKVKPLQKKKTDDVEFSVQKLETCVSMW